MPAAITDAYATAAEYRAATNESSNADDAAILANLKAISRYIDNLSSRTFNQDAEDTTRLYVVPARTNHPPDALRLSVDDLVSVTSITVDQARDGSFTAETAFGDTEFELHPLNADADPDPRPFTSIIITPWATAASFPVNARVEVIGIHGFPSVPGPVKQATIEITRLLRLDTARAKNVMNVSSDRIESIIPDARKIVTGLLLGYFRADAFV